jgi:4-amino-4-deoxy-L-arabinose transferase-like glycosyltransferase
MNWRSQRAFLLVLAVVAPLAIAFSWQEVIASLGDDSVSYLTLARYLSPFSSDPQTTAWAGYHSHFPPLFPLLLALTGGAYSLLAAHLLVAACSLIAFVLVYRYAALRLQNETAALLVAIAFLLAPTAWVSARGILSEPLYLAMSLAALSFHERRPETERGKAGYLVFGMLLAGACLTRVAGIALVAAYAAYLLVGAVGRKRLPSPWAALAFVLPLASILVWMALRPQPPVDSYGQVTQDLIAQWLAEPARMLWTSWHSLLRGWLASFAGDSTAGFVAQFAFTAVGLLGIAGSIRAALRNRIDGWYVLASLAMLFLWVFPEDNTRRALYPLVPLLLIHAAEALCAGLARLKAPRLEWRVALGAWALVVVLMLPASLLVFQKALDREPLVAGFAYNLSGITEYYTTVNVARARAIAGRHAAVLAGIESIDRTTPPGARVMWVRPEYVALLGKRQGVAWYFAWDRPALAREIRASATDYLVVAGLHKSDLRLAVGDAFTPLVRDPPPYLRPALIIASPADGKMEFALLEVDRAALDRYLAEANTR